MSNQLVGELIVTGVALLTIAALYGFVVELIERKRPGAFSVVTMLPVLVLTSALMLAPFL